MMNFKVWFRKKIKKQSSSLVVDSVKPRAKGEQEPKEESQLESNVQSFKQLVQKEQAATPKQPEPILDIPAEEHQIPLETRTSGDDNTNDYILNILQDLPEQWLGKVMRLHVIIDRRDATWIMKRLFQDVERGLITAQFTVRNYEHMCDITLMLKIADGLASFPSAVTAINPVFSYILADIKSELIYRRKRKALRY